MVKTRSQTKMENEKSTNKEDGKASQAEVKPSEESSSASDGAGFLAFLNEIKSFMIKSQGELKEEMLKSQEAMNGISARQDELKTELKADIKESQEEMKNSQEEIKKEIVAAVSEKVAAVESRMDSVEQKIGAVEEQFQLVKVELEREFQRLEHEVKSVPSGVVLNGGIYASPKMSIKLPNYDGTTAWSVYKTQFEMVSQANQWDDNMKATQLHSV